MVCIKSINMLEIISKYPLQSNNLYLLCHALYIIFKY